MNIPARGAFLGLGLELQRPEARAAPRWLGVLQARALIGRKQQLVADLFARHLLPITAQGYDI